MKYLKRRIILSVAMVIMVCCFGNGGACSANTLSVKEISMAEAMAAWRNKEVIFIDVRTPEEYAEGHVPGAILLPLSELENNLSKVDREKKVLLICGSGRRSANANIILQKNGYVNTYSVRGGMLAWQEEVEK